MHGEGRRSRGSSFVGTVPSWLCCVLPHAIRWRDVGPRAGPFLSCRQPRAPRPTRMFEGSMAAARPVKGLPAFLSGPCERGRADSPAMGGTGRILFGASCDLFPPRLASIQCTSPALRQRRLLLLLEACPQLPSVARRAPTSRAMMLLARMIAPSVDGQPPTSRR